MTGRKRKPASERFWAHVEKADGCWLWTASVGNHGYGVFALETRSTQLAHRFSFELHVGPIPTGHHIHHRCGNRRCVRPDHLESVTPVEHVRLTEGHAANRAECTRGHPFTLENTYRTPEGRRRCRTCVRMRERITDL